MPFSLKTGEIVPCGRCPECRKRRASAWSFRLLQEEKVSDSAWFITLTYAKDNLPYSRNGFRELSPRDLQLFFKRLRRFHDTDIRTQKKRSTGLGRSVYSKPLKYYAVGEYGGKFKRPHYHIILFNAKIEMVEKAWTSGHIHYGKVESASVGYVLKYVSDDAWRPMHRNDDRCPQFSRMSQGLGKNYLTPAMCRWHKNDMLNRMYCNINGGKKIAMPRYYKLRLYSESERKAIGDHIASKMSDRPIYSLDEVLTSVEGVLQRSAYRSKLNQSI